jgi:hypothetical protein
MPVLALPLLARWSILQTFLQRSRVGNVLFQGSVI